MPLLLYIISLGRKLSDMKFTSSLPALTDAAAAAALDAAARQVRINLPLYTDRCQNHSSVHGIYPSCDNNQWTCGFWPGEIWLSYERTGDEAFRASAETLVRSFADRIDRKIEVDHHDMGFLYVPSCVAAYKLTGSELGKQAKALIDAGELVPDAVVEGMIENAFDTVKGVDGFLLDGFPRNLQQAADLDAILAKRGEAVTAVVALMIPDEMIYTRIQGRALIEGRADDASDEVISNRIKTYHTQTEPLIEYYSKAGKYHEVECTRPTIEENRANVLALVDSIA